MPLMGESLALATAVVWAFAVIMFKRSGETVHPIGLNLFKNLLAIILLTITLIIIGKPIQGEFTSTELTLMLLSGVLGIAIADTLFFKSLNILGAGLSAIVQCLYSPTVILAAILVLNEKLTFVQSAGVVLIITAIVIATHVKDRGTNTRRQIVIGVLFAIGGMVANALGIVIIKPILDQSPLLWVTIIRLIGGSLSLVLLLSLSAQRKAIINSVRLGMKTFYIWVGSFLGAYLGMMLWLGGMKFTQTSIASALNQTSAMFIFIFAVWLLKEPLNQKRIIGIILAAIGVYFVAVR